MAENVLRFSFLATDRASPVMDKIAGKADRLGSSFGKFAGVAATALKGVAVAGIGLGTAAGVMGVKTASGLEQAQIGFTSLTHSSTTARNLLANLSKFAAATPFTLPGLIDSSRLLLGVGVSAKNVIPTLQAWGDAAGALGISQDRFNSAMLAVTQSMGAGKINAQDMNQIVNAGIPVWNLMAEATGKTVPELRKLSSEGKLLSSDILPKLQKQMEKDYGGAMARQSQTLAGLWSTLTDTINIGLATAIQPLIPIMKQGVAGAIQIAGAAFARIPAVMTAVIGAFQTTLGVARQFIPVLSAAFHGDWTAARQNLMSALDGVYDHVGGAGARRLIGGLNAGLRKGDWTYLSSALTDGLRGAFAGIRDNAVNVTGKVAGFLQSVDWPRLGGILSSGLAAALAGSKSGAAQVGNALGGWLNGIDWHHLGTLVGNGLIGSIAVGGVLSGRIGSMIAGWFDKIDWLQLGKNVAGKAVPFAVGFGQSFLSDIIDFAFHHPLELGKFLLAWIPFGKLTVAWKPLRAVIEALPFGKAFVTAMEHSAAPAFDGIVRFMRFLGRGFMDGMREVFPSLEKGLAGRMSRLADGIRLQGLYARDNAEGFVAGIARGIGHGTGLVIRGIGILIRDMVSPFARAGSWLIRSGADLIVGLARGAGTRLGVISQTATAAISRAVNPFRGAGRWLVADGAGTLRGYIGGIAGQIGPLARTVAAAIGRATSPFRGAGRWLVSEGSNTLRGFINGIGSQLGGVSRAAGSAISRATSPFRGASRWLIGAGGSIIGGLIAGMFGWTRGIPAWIKHNVVDNIVVNVKRFFGIRSPSTVMAGIGGHLIGGLMQGMMRHDITGWIGRVFGGMPKALGAIVGKGLIPFTSLPGKAMAALGGLGGALGSILGIRVSAGGSGVSRWAPLVLQALSMVGQPASLLGITLRRMNQESGGNPNAINLWDINALHGDPSRGLMQTISSTFRAYHYPGTSWNIYDPLANILASMRYALSRYGSLASAYGRSGGYDAGGVATGAGLLLKPTVAPERVLSAGQTRSFDRLVRVLDRGGPAGGPVEVHYHFPNYLGPQDELVRVLNRLNRQGRLDVIKSR